MTVQTKQYQVDVDRYRREGFLTAPAVLFLEQLLELRLESERLLQLCAGEPERYAKRIEWEIDPYLLHYSDLNRSQVPSRAIIYTYNPARLGKINEHRFPDDSY